MGGNTVQEMELFIPPGLTPLERWLSITARPLRDAQGRLTGAVAVVRDISDAKRAELALRESEERYALAARGANDGLWDWDLRSNQVHFSPRWKAMLGFTEDELTTNPDEWFQRVHPDDIERLTTGLAAHQHRLDSHFEYEYRIQHRDGVYRWMLSRGLAVWDDMGRALRMAGSQTDITVRKQFEEQLLHAALHDSLTGLPNRALFLDRLGQVLNHTHRNPNYRFAVFFLDLDRFKVINDSLGHAVGDQLLITIANRLRECLRPGDTIARLGGDEFTVLLEGVHDAQAAHEIAERIQRTLAAPLHLGEQQVYTTTSIGILLGHSEYHTAAEIVRDADIAMYQAKMKGKARAVVFDPTMHIKVVSHLQMESELRTALEEGQLRVHYQPIVALDTGQIEGVEALVRWQHPQQGLLTPGSFLAVAEESGLIVPISWWVLREACQQLHIWQQEIPAAQALWVSVNLAPQQLAETDAVTTIRTILQESGLAPTCLKLEITEHTLVEYGEATAQAIAKLRQDGVQLCIDDFGTGYSSLSYLHLLPADVLKIDRSFISRMGERTDRTEIVHTIIALARALGMKAVAEGTETATQADELRRVACDFGQGWLFSKPVDAEALAKLVRTGHSLFTTPAPVMEPLAA
jgi:diguanylate cyclase (GGDEF)-like protein/PAS domain S-box-containing protein